MNPGPAYTKIAKSAKAPVALLPLFPSCKRNPGSVRGTVILVTLCFVAVLGIVLASYLAVCSRAMQMSNRNFQWDLSKQLAEAGIDEALRAFNKNLLSGTDTTAALADWSSGSTSVDWSLDTSNNRATATISFSPAKFGQGVTASVKIRIDNYNGAQLTADWVSGTNYRISDVVNYNGTWYRCVRATNSQAPSAMTNMPYWVPAPIGSFWDSTTTYRAHDVVYYTSTNTWYRCTTAPTLNQVPTDTGYWTSISKISVDAGYSSINGEVLNYYGTWYYYNSSASPYWFNTPAPQQSYAPIISWVWRSTSYSYRVNDLVCYGNPAVWYRCKLSHTSSTSFPPTNTTYWENALTASWDWNSADSFNLNDVVYRSGAWYRCIKAHTNQGPPNAAYWSTSPLRSTAWDSARRYSANDVVRYNGIWYRCLVANNTSNPATNTTNWASAANSSYYWNSSTTYTSTSYVSYGGIWYKCSTGHTNKTPNDTGYWSALAGQPVVYAEATVIIAGNPSAITQLRSSILPASLFPNALAASETLSITGSGTAGTIDSYDGSYNYTYNLTSSPFSAASPNLGYSAVLAAGSTAYGAVSVGQNTTIKGYVATASTATTASLASFATDVVMRNSDGSITSAHPNAANVDNTRVSRSPIIPQFSIQSVIQHTSISTTIPTTLSLGTPGAVTPSIYTFAGNVTVGAGCTININGPVILDVQGNLSTNTGTINIAPTGSLEVHVSGRLLIETSSGGFYNRTSDPKNLIILATGNTGTSYYRATTYPFYGCIYMPNNSSTNGLSIGTGVTIYGAISAKNLSFSNEATVHYDTSLRYATFGGVDQPYTTTNWTELSTTEAATMTSP